MQAFESLFQRSPAVCASAPGRVNLLGEHTDYNDGYVLPTAIPQKTWVELAAAGDGICRFYSVELEARGAWDGPGHPVPEGFAALLVGCLEVLRGLGHAVPAVCALVRSTVPMGAGLSSSAALEVAFLRALRELFHLELDDVALARAAQRAEVEYAGVSCGLMDQLASSLADTSHLLFLDTRSLERHLLPIPEGAAVLVLDSGVPRRLAESGYNQRRAECEAAARLLSVRALRDVTELSRLEVLPELLCRRARHVVSENARVLEARSGVSAARFGQLMNASHASLRDDFEVSVPMLDRLVSLLQAHPEVHGARLTGAGFGGACVALVARDAVLEVGQRVAQDFTLRGGKPKILVPTL